MILGRPWLLPLAWVLGVAGQLQQSALWPWPAYALMLLLGGLFGMLAIWRPGWRVWPTWLLAGLLLGAGLTGSRATWHAAQALPSVLEGRDLRVSGRIASLPQTTPLGQRFELLVQATELDGQPVSLPPRLQLSWFGAARGGANASIPVLRAGERWQFTVRLRQPHGNRNPHGWDRERWLWEQGIGATGYVRNGPRDPMPQRVGQAHGFPVLAARQWVAERIEARVGEPRSAGVLAALVVGEQSAIEREDWDLYRTTGVAHLMSISGLHVTMFAWLAVALMGWGWRRAGLLRPGLLLAVPAPWAASVGGVALAGAYALFSGWGVPAQRTVLMLAVVVALRLTVRQWPWPMVWLLAMCAVLVLDPWAFLQPGFWLSFVAVGVLFATDAGRRDRFVAPSTEPQPPVVRRASGSALGLLREQAVVTVALAPLALLLFGQFSVVGLVANLVAIPWVTLLVTPLAMLGMLVPPLWDLAALAVQGLGLVLQWLGQWPWAAIHRAVAPLPLALAAVLGGVLLVMRWPVLVRSAGLLLMLPAFFWSPPRPAPGAFELMAIDVGQGSAVLVRTAGHSLLFDAGPRYSLDSDAGQRVVVPLLRALGERPDAVVISHRDSDHAGGAEAVRAAWPQARWLSSYDPDPALRCLAGQRWVWDGVDFEVLHPGPEHYRPDGSGLLSSNAMSCTLLIRAGDQGAWLSGDLDAERETRLALARPDLRATLMLAPHHGSRSSSTPVLLNTLKPRWVLVQSGYRNRFGHPAPEVLARYRERDLRWVTSPDCGAATWRSDEPDEVRCERDRSRRYWHHRSPGQAGGEALGETVLDLD